MIPLLSNHQQKWLQQYLLYMWPYLDHLHIGLDARVSMYFIAGGCSFL